MRRGTTQLQIIAFWHKLEQVRPQLLPCSHLASMSEKGAKRTKAATSTTVRFHLSLAQKLPFRFPP